MTNALVVKEGPQAGRRLELDGELVIGREGDAEIDDKEVSRRHAVIRPAGGGFELEDLGSQNGTFVNGARIAGPTRIVRGDVIKVGQTELELETEAAVDSRFAPAPPGATRLGAALVPPPAPSAPPAPPPAALSAAPSAPFGAYAVPKSRRRRGIASRQYGPLILCWAVVVATAVALAIYFSNHPA